MNIIKQIITYLFAIIYLVFSLNFFLNFIPMPELDGDAALFMGILATSGFMVVVKIIELVVALMLLFNFKRPLAWLLILPVSTNIIMYEVFIAGIVSIGLVVMLMNLFMVYQYREKYKCIWQ